MAEQQTMAADPGVIPDTNRLGRIDKGHLHDLAIFSYYQTGIWELQPSDKNLFIDLTPIPDFQMGGVKYSRGTYHDMSSDDNLGPSQDGQES